VIISLPGSPGNNPSSFAPARGVEGERREWTAPGFALPELQIDAAELAVHVARGADETNGMPAAEPPRMDGQKSTL
jgi:hypothetical protein